MSTSSQSAQRPTSHAPTRMRTIIACKNCRKRKSRCITTEEPPIYPCTRCRQNNLACEYVATVRQEAQISSQPPPGNASGSPAAASAVPAGRYAPPLPYTGPPLPNSRPRYTGGAYPDLSLRPDSAGPRQQPAYTQPQPQYTGGHAYAQPISTSHGDPYHHMQGADAHHQVVPAPAQPTFDAYPAGPGQYPAASAGRHGQYYSSSVDVGLAGQSYGAERIIWKVEGGGFGSGRNPGRRRRSRTPDEMGPDRARINTLTHACSPPSTCDLPALPTAAARRPPARSCSDQQDCCPVRQGKSQELAGAVISATDRRRAVACQPRSVAAASQRVTHLKRM
ncbi:hypothetical protein GGX14DRAFT_398918 [Mycena pura]|uniref:Zn(2)-C6 fungal-type domain-containing protein n=1 Tax=Mycena pura TaxID=153505 RepID=A0AAD6V5J2_9AGAR|nr:hypothetical protein GGX14DRAFT_398918 [Mycena pura]